MVLFYFFLFIFITLSIVLSFTILIQESKSMGLGSSFGGDSSDSLFGASTADVLKKFTAYVAAFFMIASIFLSLWTSVLGRNRSRISLPKKPQEIQREINGS